MRRNQIVAITLCSLAGLAYANRSANAGWFGSGNYEECVLEKMKGQLPYMVKTARDACRLKFPCNDKFLVAYQKCMDQLAHGESADEICAESASQFCSNP
jgi:hypothetical protein